MSRNASGHARASLRGKQNGWTLVELLVVMVILAVLASLLLPAVQTTRERARRLACAHHLHQIGLGMHAYHDTYRTFPPGGVEWRGSVGNRKLRQLAWSAYLLPFVGEASLYDALDLSTPFDSSENAVPAATVLRFYLCPSSVRESPLVEGRGGCDYGGIFGERIQSPNSPPKGTMLYDRAISLSEIADGSSHTLLIGEDARWPEGQWINGRNVFDQAYAINASPPFENDIRSEHPGGANGLLADGSARFLNENMVLAALAALCTREGGEAVTAY